MRARHKVVRNEHIAAIFVAAIVSLCGLNLAQAQEWQFKKPDRLTSKMLNKNAPAPILHAPPPNELLPLPKKYSNQYPLGKSPLQVGLPHGATSYGRARTRDDPLSKNIPASQYANPFH